MDVINSDILSTLQSRVITREEFDFEKLSARPLATFLDYSDLDKLYNVASSVRYAGNIQKKLKAIAEIMKPRGFIKQGQGTNRIVYRHLEDTSIVLKIATDKTGMRDTPKEFLNQEKLKPFVTKVFEVTPDGVVGEFERVQPITSREEYLSCANDAYELLNTLTGKYILADIGTNFFMNTGIRTRNNFGLVLLDFSFLYEVDGNKLMCRAPSQTDPFGICGGWIDYDKGFNEFRCNKCGAVYKAVELAKDISENKIVKKGSKHKMKVAVNWKGKVSEHSLDGQLVNNNEFKPATPAVKPVCAPTNVGKLKVGINRDAITKKVDVVVKDTVKVEEKVEVIKPVIEEKKEEVVTPVETKVEEPVEKEEVKVEESVVEEPKQEVVVEDKKKSGLKVKVNQDGKAVEKVVDKKKDTKKTSGVKVKDYTNKNSNNPYAIKRGPIELTAIRFDQLKEMDFKYSSTDLEFHKMFFKQDYGTKTVSVMVDFDSIPKDKLELIGNVVFEDEDLTKELQATKDELEKAKYDLNETEEGMLQLRQLDTKNAEKISKLEFENQALAEDNRRLREEIEGTPNTGEYTAKIAELESRLDEAEQIVKESAKLDEKISDLEAVNEQQHIQLDRLLKENAELKAKLESLETKESVEVEEDTTEEVTNVEEEYETSDPEGFTFINGELHNIENIAEKYNLSLEEEEVPSSKVIVFNADDYIIRDNENRIVCIAYIQNNPIDSLTITKKATKE